MQVAFWSTVHGQSATTSNTLAIAVLMALEYRLKLLITHNHFERSTMERALLDKDYVLNTIVDLSDTGIDGLSRFAKFNMINTESISNYTTTIIQGRLDLLMGTNNVNKELYYRDINEAIESILLTANAYYDLVFVDVTSGDSPLSEKFIQYADLLVVNLNQNLYVLEEFFEKYNNLHKNVVYLIGNYNKDSRYNLSALRRKYNIEDKKISVIPYCRAFADAANEGRVVDYFIKNINATKEDYTYLFMEEIRKAVKMILNNLEIDISFKKVGG